VPGSEIIGAGSYLPDRVVSSEEIAETLGVTAEWIHSRTGIRTRHIAADGESVVDMATHAALRSVAAAGAHAATVDAVIVATSTGDRMPSTASQVAARLDLTCAAFDINAACAGFCHALAVADGLITGGAAGSVLVIGVDRSSTSLDWHDRNTAPLFGDGAGAVLLRRGAVGGITRPVWGSFGNFGGLVELRTGSKVIRQDGPAVFRWAIGLGDLIDDTCRAGGIDAKEVAAFVPHQANLRIIDALAAGLPAPQTRVARDVVDVGNTMAASIPTALARMSDRGEVPAGEPVLLFGFGSGLSYAGQIVRVHRDFAAHC
jgi:3-oxoacyl-[acyl-carrier-protein] synthase-3